MARSPEKIAAITTAKTIVAGHLIQIRKGEEYLASLRQAAAPAIAELCAAGGQNGPYAFVLAEGAAPEKLQFRHVRESSPSEYAIKPWEEIQHEEL